MAENKALVTAYSGLTKAALEGGQEIPDGVVVTAYSQVKLASK